MLEVINDFLSGKVLIVLMVGLGGYFTIRSRFVQFRYFLHMFAVFKDSLRSSAGPVLVGTGRRADHGSVADGHGPAQLTPARRRRLQGHRQLRLLRMFSGGHPLPHATSLPNMTSIRANVPGCVGSKARAPSKSK